MTADIPLACNLNALDPAARARHAEVTTRLRTAVQDAADLPDGYALQLPADDESIALAAEFITRERVCCPFFHFSLEVHGPAVRLALTGPAGVKALLDPDFRPEGLGRA